MKKFGLVSRNFNIFLNGVLEGYIIKGETNYVVCG